MFISVFVSHLLIHKVSYDPFSFFNLFKLSVAFMLLHITFDVPSPVHNGKDSEVRTIHRNTDYM